VFSDVVSTVTYLLMLNSSDSDGAGAIYRT